MTVKLTSNKAAAVTDDLAFIVRNAIAYIKVLEAELARCKQTCAATSEAWREEAALAEPVQEPVAFAHINGTSDTKWHPPQRKPLTEEEIKQLLFESAGMTVTFSAVDLSLARAIERAHGIKENT